MLVVGGFDKKVLLTNLSSGTQLKHVAGTGHTARSVHLSADGHVLALGCEADKGSGVVMLYSLPTCEHIHSWQVRGFGRMQLNMRTSITTG